MLIKYLRSLLKSSFRHERKLDLNAVISVDVSYPSPDLKNVTSPVDGKLFIQATKKDSSTKSYMWLRLKATASEYIGVYSQIEGDRGRIGTSSLDVTKGQQINLYGFTNLEDVKVFFVPYTNS